MTADADTAYCSECGAEIRRAAEICPECGVRHRPRPSALDAAVDGRNPLVAALLSAIFPGLGHIYAHDVGTGLFFAVSFVCSLFLILVVVGLVLAPAIWLYALFHAAKTAQRRDQDLSNAAAV